MAPPVGANPVAGGSLSTVGPLPSLVYDGHGDTTRLADQQISYDVADRHQSTVLDDGTSVVYVRDVSGRVVARTATPPSGPAVTTKYTFAGGGDGAYAVLDAAGALTQRTVGLPGGVMLSARYMHVSDSGGQSRRANTGVSSQFDDSRTQRRHR